MHFICIVLSPLEGTQCGSSFSLTRARFFPGGVDGVVVVVVGGGGGFGGFGVGFDSCDGDCDGSVGGVVVGRGVALVLLMMVLVVLLLKLLAYLVGRVSVATCTLYPGVLRTILCVRFLYHVACIP